MPATVQTIFNGGLYRARLINADVAAYRQTVLTAFKQVEDALAGTRVYSQQILRQQEAVKSSQQFLDMEMQRYNTGVDPYVDVVTTETTLLGSQITLKSLQAEEMLSAMQFVQRLRVGVDLSQLHQNRCRPGCRIQPTDAKRLSSEDVSGST